MCQMNVVLKNNGGQEKIMENVTHLEVTTEGVLVSAFFCKKPKSRRFNIPMQLNISPCPGWQKTRH